MDTSLIARLLCDRGLMPVPASADELGAFSRVMSHRGIAGYLSACLTQTGFAASGVRVKSLPQLREENGEGSAPGGFIFPFGYLVVATSVGGNAICFSAGDGKVYWADHTAFDGNEVAIQNRRTQEWSYLPFSETNIPKALELLDDDMGHFLCRLLQDELDADLEALDT